MAVLTFTNCFAAFFSFAVLFNVVFCTVDLESEYRDLLKFDESIESLKKEYSETQLTDPSQTNHSNAVNFANIALMYHQRDTRWKQGGNINALEYMNKAIDLSKIAEDPINDISMLICALHLHKGLLLSDLGHGFEAIRTFDTILQLDVSHNELSEITMDSTVDDSNHLESCNQLNARDISSVLYHKADTLLTHFRNSSTAIDLFQQAIDLYPCNYNAYLKIIMAFQDENKLQHDEWKEWIKILETTLQNIQQINASTIVLTDSTQNNTVLCRFEDQDLATSISALNNIVHINLIRGTIYAALHIAADAIVDYTLAWKYLQFGRHMDRYMANRITQYDIQRNIQLTTHVVNYFRPGYWPPTHLATKPNMMGTSSQLPIFIVGFFRSGSTLLETMLDAHPNIWGMGEGSPFGFEMYAMQDHMHEAILKQRNMNTTLTDVEVEVDGVTSSETSTSRRQTQDDELSDEFSSPYASVIKEHANTVLLKMNQVYQEAQTRLYDNSQESTTATTKSDKKITRIVDKMLANYYNIGVIHLMFPRAIILHTVRDPLDTLFSCYKNRFADPGTTYTLNLKHLVKQYTLYLEIIAHFRKVLPDVYLSNSNSLQYNNGDSQQKKRFKPLVDVRYEELVANPERVMRNVLNLLNLPWSDKVLQHYKHNRTVHTASVLQVKKNIYRSSIGSWRMYAKQLNETLIPELRQELAKLKAKGVEFPFSRRGEAEMNWGLSDKFNYTRMMEQLR